MPTLHVLQGPDKGRTYHTPNEPARIGRQADQIQLSDDSASRQHAELRPVNGSWILRDLKSSNGTFLNGQRIVNPTPIKHGDQIKVGSSLLVFSGDEASTLAQNPMIRDLVDIEMGGTSGGSSILSAIDGSEESVILQPPETADAVAAWNVVYKVAEMIGAGEPINSFLERLADILFDHLMVDHLVILMYENGHKRLKPRVLRYRGDKREKPRKIATSKTIIKHVVDTKEGLLCANALTDTRFKSEDMQDSIHQLGLRSVICVPIVAHDEVPGMIHLDCSMSHHAYTQEQLRLVVAIGRLAGMAIENARLLESRMRHERLAATGETVAYLSHHIRNILQGMQGGAEIVERGHKNKSIQTAESGWRMVRRNLDRIYYLTINMLTFSKDRQPRIETTQLNRVLEDVVSLAQSKADERGAMLLMELEDIPAIPLDPEGIHQVAHNIVLNAIQACPDQGGRINIATTFERKSGDVVLSISDNGHGIPADEIDSIFNPFQSTKGHAGTGLGLAASRKIITEMKGTIRVTSDPGEGSTFLVHLPGVHVKLADSDKTHGPGKG
ncbi:MAG: ATP-binding protein [Planctomycetota bacterium]